MDGHQDPTRVDVHHVETIVELGGLATRTVATTKRPAAPRVDVCWPTDETRRLLG